MKRGIAAAERNRETILAEIRRLTAENDGQPPGIQTFLKETGIRRGDWIGRYWARWGDAVRDAGFEPNELTPRHDDDVLVRALIEATRKLGHLPTRAEFDLERRRDPSLPHFTAIVGRLGTSQTQRAARAVAYCEAHVEFADVVDIFRKRISQRASTPAEDPRGDRDLIAGEVYLFKVARHYKIGRSNASGRRGRELVLLMPEKGEMVHSIKTDDPAGIEAYWHRRYELKRKNGEWFDLDAADVQAFKRRKFM